MTIPAWLQNHLEALGRWDTDGIRRAAAARLCRCGARILAALDDDVAALPVRADPAPLDAAGELAALMQGRATFRLQHNNGKWELDRRSVFDIQQQPAEETHVLPEHKCGRPIPANGPPITNPRPRISEVLECPPF